MQDQTLSATIGDTYNGRLFEQTTTENGIVSCFIDGVETDGANWSKQIARAQEEDMRGSAGEETAEIAGSDEDLSR